MKRYVLALILVGVLALVVASCEGGSESTKPAKKCTTAADCEQGQICAGGTCTNCQADVQCETDYGEGAKCQDGLCIPNECPPGQIGCPCDANGECETGECINNICVDCERGEEGCVCFNNGTCKQGLRCNDENICEVCPPGEEGCPCKENDVCDGGEDLVCEDGICVYNPCPEGTVGCPCKEGEVCDGEENLYCDDNNICQQCSNDIVGCPCDENDKCEGGLVCDEDEKTCREPIKCEDITCLPHQLCEEPEGEDARCIEACEEGWQWNPETGQCEEIPPTPNCQPGAEGSILDQCEALNRVCVEETDNAHCGDCKPYYTDENGSLETCRELKTCAEIDCASENRQCVERTETEDAHCGDCLEGYIEVNGECQEYRTCEPDAMGSILSECEAQNRTCVEEQEGLAHCGDCKPWFVDEGGSLETCRPVKTCDDIGAECASLQRFCEDATETSDAYCGDCYVGTTPDPNDPNDPPRCIAPLTCADLDCESQGMFCVEGENGQSARCIEAPCPEGQAWSDFGGGCVQCYVNCNREGSTGRIWPYTPQGSTQCICETKPGYYWTNEGERGPRPCDEDGDGWVRFTAKSAIESTDEAIRQNARCNLRVIDRFVLENEYKQRLEVFICEEEPYLSIDRESCTIKPIGLYESKRNDKQSDLETELNLAPSYEYNLNGRQPRASEINSLTKYCVSTLADYNDNGISDIGEWQGMNAEGMPFEEMMIYLKMSYFAELYHGWYEERGPDSIYGKYVISERSRCDDDFPFVYPELDGDYWRECTRNRDSAFNWDDDPNQFPDFGMDFAQWSCSATSGTCPVPPPPTEVDPENGEIPAHGLCSVALPPHDSECNDENSPWLCVDGGVWRGMSHHSQFKCVVINSESSVEEPHLSPDELSNGSYAFNSCHIACPVDDADCSTDCTEDGCTESTEAPSHHDIDPWRPKIVCEQNNNPNLGTVGFALVRYVNESANGYKRGCINEWNPYSEVNVDENSPEVYAWRSLCPGWVDNHVAVKGDGNPLNFGLLECGCGVHYGGLSCEIGCPTRMLHVPGDYDPLPRETSGYWMCADFAASGYEGEDEEYGPASVNESGTYILRGEVPIVPIVGPVMCQNPDDCSSGYSLYGE